MPFLFVMDIARTLRQGFTALNAGHFKQAAELGRAALLEDNQVADGWFLMAMVAAANVRVPKAMELLQQALDLDSGNPEYLAQKAKLLTMTSNPATAEAIADQVAIDADVSPLTADTLGVVYSKTGISE